MIREIWASATDNASWFIGLRSAKADEDEVDVGIFEIIIRTNKKKNARLNLEERKSQIEYNSRLSSIVMKLLDSCLKNRFFDTCDKRKGL